MTDRQLATAVVGWLIGSLLGTAIVLVAGPHVLGVEPYEPPPPPTFADHLFGTVERIECLDPATTRGCPGPVGPSR